MQSDTGDWMSNVLGSHKWDLKLGILVSNIRNCCVVDPKSLTVSNFMWSNQKRKIRIKNSEPEIIFIWEYSIGHSIKLVCGRSQWNRTLQLSRYLLHTFHSTSSRKSRLRGWTYQQLMIWKNMQGVLSKPNKHIAKLGLIFIKVCLLVNI